MAARTIATMPTRVAAGSVGHASTTATKSASASPFFGFTADQFAPRSPNHRFSRRFSRLPPGSQSGNTGSTPVGRCGGLGVRLELVTAAGGEQAEVDGRHLTASVARVESPFLKVFQRRCHDRGVLQAAGRQAFIASFFDPQGQDRPAGVR